MKLEKFKQNKKLKNTLLTLGLISIILGGGIILYRTYALYQDKHEYNVIKGVIPDFGYDVKFAIKVDNNKATSIPDRQANNGNYYKVEADCGESTKAEWDYNAWNLKVDNIQSNSKCSLTFTSNLTKEEYDEYIKSGIEYRRNTYRGKDITNLKTSGSLYTQISNCTFDDIYVGDYIKGNNNVTWLIADLNNYLHTGNTELTKCHATIIPAGSLGTGKMNATDTTEGGYLKSEMKTKTLSKILSEYVLKDFISSHIITYKTILSSGMDPARSNQYGTGGGASSSWEWVGSQIDLMSEVNVYGSIVWSSSGYDIGIDNDQYAIFKLRPELKYTDGNGKRYWYWLKAITGSTDFAIVSDGGCAIASNASNTAGGIRPKFLID